jgi:hypothetical protein
MIRNLPYNVLRVLLSLTLVYAGMAGCSDTAPASSDTSMAMALPSAGSAGALSADGGGGTVEPALGGSDGTAGGATAAAGMPSAQGGVANEPGVDPGASDAGSSSVVAASIVFVAGTSNDTSAPGEAIGDQFVIERLQTLGHMVLLRPDTTPAAELQSDAENADLVIVAESTTSTDLTDKLRDVSTSVMCFEAFIQDDLSLTAEGPPGDPGLPDSFALGVKEDETDIDIVDPTHPLAAGLSGTVTVYNAPKSITWGTVAESATVVATLPGAAAGASIYVYEAGDALFDGSTAAGLRLGYFLEDDNDTGTPNLMTEDGLLLFDTAIDWILAQ